MELNEIFILLITTFILLFIVFYIGYLVFDQYLHQKYRAIYSNHSEKHGLWLSYHENRNCPRGCNRKKECPFGNYCYNCQGGTAQCCCYDSQCKEC